MFGSWVELPEQRAIYKKEGRVIYYFSLLPKLKPIAYTVKKTSLFYTYEFE